MVRWLAGDRSGADFEPLGALRLEGLPEPVGAFLVPWSGRSTAERVPFPPALAMPSELGFVGREEEWGTLDGLWEAAAAGEPRVALLGGEAGAGKTRLAAEYARARFGHGAAVLFGTCDAQLVVPYQPWTQALEQLLRVVRPDELAAETTADLGALAALLPSLDRGAGPRTSERPIDADMERLRLFNAVEAVLAEAAVRWPVVLVLDDLHWASAQTLALLGRVARSGGLGRMLVIATFRDTGDEMTEPLAGMLADLRRIPSVTRVRLERPGRRRRGPADGGRDRSCARPATWPASPATWPSAAAATPSSSASSGGACSRLGVVRREGDRWVVDGTIEDVGVPDSVREVVADRLGRLAFPARRLAELVAISGNRVGLQVLSHAADLPAAELATSLDELVGADLLEVIERPQLTYQFTHALVRDTVEAKVPPAARAHLHLRLAEALEAVYESDRRSRAGRAGQPLRGGGIPRRGPRRPSTTPGRPPTRPAAPSPTRSASSTSRPCSPCAMTARSPGSRRCSTSGGPRRGAASSRTRGRRTERRSASPSSSVSNGSRSRRRSGSRTPSTPRACPASPPSRIVPRGDRLSERIWTNRPGPGSWPRWRGRSPTPDGSTRPTRRCGRRSPWPRTRRTADALGAALEAALILYEDPHVLLAYGDRLEAIGVQTGDEWRVAYGTTNRLRALVTVGDLDRAAAVLDRHRTLDRGGRYLLVQIQALGFELTLALAAGRFIDAEAAAERAAVLGRSVQGDFAAGVHGLHMFAIRREQGRLEEVRPVLELVRRQPEAEGVWRPGLAVLYAELGMLDAARAELDAVAPDRFVEIPRDTLWPGSASFLADACVATGATEHASPLYEEMLAFQGYNLMMGMTVAFGPADRLLGALAGLLGRDDAALAHFDAALRLADRSGSPVWRAHVLHDWAHWRDARGDAGGARSRAEAALAEAAAVGMPALEARCRAIVDRAPAPPPPARPAYPDGLSPREVEVLRLVAEGCSNRMVGERLSISANTAANHVRAILQKTGTANRAEASTYAARRGLLDVEQLS